MSSAEVVCCNLLPNITDELSIEASKQREPKFKFWNVHGIMDTSGLLQS